MRLRVWTVFALLLLTGTAWSATSAARCQAGSIDACYDAIRWNPRDPALLVGLGDGLAHAGRPADAIRNYRRAAGMAPSFPGLTAKINLMEARMSAKHAPKKPAVSAANIKPANQFSNAAPESESH